MSNFEKIILFVFDVLVIAVLGYGVIYGNSLDITDIKAVMSISLVLNLVLIEFMLEKRG